MKIGPAKSNASSTVQNDVGSKSSAAASLHPDGQKQYYQDKFDKHPSLSSSFNSQIGQFMATPFSSEKGSLTRSTQVGADDYDVSPGWWGQGTTMQRAQADLADWSISGNTGERSKRIFQGPSGTTSANDPNEDMVSILKGGKGVGAYNVKVGGGASLGNVEERAYDLFYGGSAQSGMANFDAPDVGYGVGGGSGVQARADVADADFEVSANAGKATIGGKKVSNLVSANAVAEGSVGVQGDAEGMAYVGHQGVGLGEGISAFAGAQAGIFGQATIDGIGVGVLGQAWAGEGAKENMSLSVKNGVFTVDAGLGAALDVGGYLNFQATINFNQILQQLEGIGDAGIKLGDKWKRKDGVAGEAAGDVVGAAEGVGQLAVSTTEAIGKTAEEAAKGLSDDLVHGAESVWKKA